MTAEIPKKIRIHKKCTEVTFSHAQEKIGMLLYGRSRVDCIKNDICIMCGSVAREFRDTLSMKEFAISAMCQQCQDKFFDG